METGVIDGDRLLPSVLTRTMGPLVVSYRHFCTYIPKSTTDGRKRLFYILVVCKYIMANSHDEIRENIIICKYDMRNVVSILDP